MNIKLRNAKEYSQLTMTTTALLATTILFGFLGLLRILRLLGILVVRAIFQRYG